MHDQYSYLQLQAPRERLPRLSQSLTEARQSLAAIGASVIGTWLGAGSIGWFDNEAVVLAAWPGEPGLLAERAASLFPRAHAEVTPLTGTARPAEPAPLRTGGVHAHRWLEVEPGHEDEVVELSAEAWPAFESSFEARIEGLFRAADGSGRLLLVTWYASVADWERSRAVAGADRGALGDARRNFRRRRELTRRQVVRLAAPVA